MDILMKMLLITTQKAPFLNASTISDVLLVEELFIQDLLTKMEKMNLIERNEQGYQITEKGKTQLASGIYEEDQEATSVELLYSPNHEFFLAGDLEEVLEYEDFPETIYRYNTQGEKPTISEQVLLKEIQTFNMDDEENDHPDTIHITSIDEIEFQQINDIPCIEIILFDEKTDSISNRVWNTLLNKWDHDLENEITEKEGSTWKEKLLNQK